MSTYINQVEFVERKKIERLEEFAQRINECLRRKQNASADVLNSELAVVYYYVEVPDEAVAYGPPHDPSEGETNSDTGHTHFDGAVEHDHEDGDEPHEHGGVRLIDVENALPISKRGGGI